MGGEHKYWVGFNLTKGIGPVRLRRLLASFGDLQSAWEASKPELEAAGLGSTLSDRLVQLRSETDLDDLMAGLRSRGIKVITWMDEEYPLVLKNLEHSPPLLYVHGNLIPEDETAVAIVGTRRPTSYGRRVAQELAGALARAGVTVVSGLARGIDSEAHQEALRSGGRTIAVLGSGLDQIYPPENRHLSEKIRQNGALVSDYPLGTSPDAVNFPPRNRIISGLSAAVVVVEAGLQSGAMITAGFAADQGKEVFAAPGQIYSPQCRGTNMLIQQGARPLLDPDEVLSFLNVQRGFSQREARRSIPADPDERVILDLLMDEPMLADDLCIRTSLSIEKITSVLAIMELKGLVRREGGMRFGARQDPPSQPWMG